MTVDRTIAPAIHDAVEFDYKLPPLNSVKLDNGLSLHWLNAGVQDVVEINWVFTAGIWYESRPSLAHSVVGLIKNGTTKYTAQQINEALEFYGAHLKTAAGNDYATLTLYCLTKHLPSLLPMVLEIITDATFPQEELDIYKRNTVQKLLISLRKCDFVADQKIDAILFGEKHPYGRFSKVENIEAIGREDLVNFHKDYFNLANAQMFMGGRVGEDEVKLLNEVFGKLALEHKEIKKEKFDLVMPSERHFRFSIDPNGVQGAIRIGRHFPNRNHPDYTPMRVLNALFGGYFGSRLMANIREDKGYTYGIYSSLTPEKEGGSMVVTTETGTAVLEDAIKEVYKEMELLRQEPVDNEELLLVKNYLLGSILGDLDGPFSILQRWRTLILNGFDEAYFNENIRIYKSVTPAELHALAQKYYNKEDFFEVAVI